MGAVRELDKIGPNNPEMAGRFREVVLSYKNLVRLLSGSDQAAVKRAAKDLADKSLILSETEESYFAKWL